MKSLFAVLITLAGFVPLAICQPVSPHGWNSALNRAMAGPAAEYHARRALAPVDYAINNAGGIGYPGRGRNVAANVAYGAVAGAGFGASLQAARGGSTWKGAVAGGVGGGAAMGLVSMTMNRGGGHPLAGPADRRKGDDFTLTNNLRFAVEVYFGKGKGKYIGRLASGETWNVKGPKPGEKYSGYALIPAANGGLASDEVPIQPTRDGWMFVEPDCVRQGGR